MLEKLKSRYVIFTIIACVMFLALIVQLFNLTIIHGEEYTAQSQTRKRRSITLTGERGTIYDVNGVPLAYDQKSYDVEFYKDPEKSASSDRAYYTDIILETIDIIEKNGGEVIDTFNIKKDENGEFYFDFGIEDETAKARREENWRTNMYVDQESTPEEIYYELRERYRVPEDMTYEESFSLLSIWQEVQLATWLSYIPVTVAYNVDTNTVAEIEAHAKELEGMQIAESTERIYPKHSLAAHTIGYMGRMVDEDQIEEMEEKGYNPDDSIGVSGVEATMEDYLTGKSSKNQGERVIEIDTTGKITNEISYTPAKDGSDVTLTIDAQLQAKLEEALEQNVKDINEMQQERYAENKEEYDEVLNGREPNLANSGAAVVMEVDTGKVLAMASYPSYDLNLFTGGIDDDVYQELNEDEAAPLFNKAVSSKSIPGSVFKLVTGTAGLMEGVITVNTTIDDEGYFNKYIQEGSGEEGPACWVEPNFSRHADENIVTAIRDSCNYYFFVVADRLGIDKLNEWAANFGLTEKTGIQVTSEAVGQIGSQATLYDNTKSVTDQQTALPRLVYNKLIEDFQRYGEDRDITYTEEELAAAAERIIALAGQGMEQKGPEIRTILDEELGIPGEIANTKGWVVEISSRLSELEWNNTQTAVVGIGQSLTAVTPIAVARYMCAVLNGGEVYEAQIIEKITDSSGNVVQEFSPKLVRDLEIPDSYVSALKQGMKEVVSGEDGGTASDLFKDFKYADQIGGKTGTGQVTTGLELENNGWFVLFAPFDDPEIVVVVCVPNGYSGTSAGPTARDIVGYYLDQKEAQESDTLPNYGALVH